MGYNVKGLNKLSKQLNDFVIKAGFNGNDVPLRMLLIVTEISEALEAFRKDNFEKLSVGSKVSIQDIPDDLGFQQAFKLHIKDSLEDELADCVIRMLDLCGFLDVDIEYHIQQKMRYNETRGFKYGGKKF